MFCLFGAGFLLFYFQCTRNTPTKECFFYLSTDTQEPFFFRMFPPTNQPRPKATSHSLSSHPPSPPTKHTKPLGHPLNASKSWDLSRAGQAYGGGCKGERACIADGCTVLSLAQHGGKRAGCLLILIGAQLPPTCALPERVGAPYVQEVATSVCWA